MGLDSIELLMEVEKHFSISIPDREAEKAYSVGKLVDCVGKILGVASYNFLLRERTFALVKSKLLELEPESKEFALNNRVADSLRIQDKELIIRLQNRIHLKMPGIDTECSNNTGIRLKVKKWLAIIKDVDFATITWKKYTDIILAVNLENLSPPVEYNSKYEIYLAIMRITVDKIGVSYSEIGIEKSFTDDLAVD